MIDLESQSMHTLLAFAGRRDGIDAMHCKQAFAYLGAAERLRSSLRNALARHRLSELQFAILGLLLDVEPEPIPMTVLAKQSGASRSAVTEAFDGLIASGLAGRVRNRHDRRIIQGQITAVGREITERAIRAYLEVAMNLSRESLLPCAAAISAGVARGQSNISSPSRELASRRKRAGQPLGAN